MSPVRIGIIIGSTRPGRVGDQVAKWVLAQATARTDAEFELVDLADFALPMMMPILTGDMRFLPERKLLTRHHNLNR